MVKHLHKVLEEHRTAVRNIRRDGNDAIKKAMKDKKITEDDEKRAMDEIQKLTDDEIKKMEDMSKAQRKRSDGDQVVVGLQSSAHDRRSGYPQDSQVDIFCGIK